METRREERIGQLLQELKRSDKLHLKDARRPAWGFGDDDSSRSEQPQCARRFCSAAILFWNRAVPAITC
ncbi:deoxyribose operon repressor [Escherichia coli]|uniref:Deoxyribose operon repressor n=1 Tax=Escherichia coli TaxID=562 RepID=A0A376RN98_ECOLX|nr:deoxyribose operon repressor [Escherichia coli]